MPISTHTSTRRPKTKFGEEYACAIRKWGELLSAGTAPIVAISRKAPRLLELGVREGLIPDTILHRMTSERGMAFTHFGVLPQPLKVCDDVVIVGSTFNRISSVAREICGVDRVVGLPFAVSSKAVTENLEVVRAGAPVTLTNDACTSFILSEVAAFGFLNKPYDIEHPILYADLAAGATPSAIERVLESFVSENNLLFYATPRNLTAANGEREKHCAWTILFRQHDLETKNGEIRKIRCYLDTEQSRLLIVPIQTREGTLEEFEACAAKLPAQLIDCWQWTSSIARQEHVLAQATQNRSLVAWANYLLELADLQPTFSHLRVKLLHQALLVGEGKLYLTSYDLQLLIGNSEAELNKARLEAFANSTSHVNESKLPICRRHALSSLIPEEYVSGYQSLLAELLQGTNCVVEVLSAIFKAQHLQIELKTRDCQPTNPRRLEFGVPFSYLVDVVENTLGPVQAQEIHQALDGLIDSGVIVPRYLSQSVNNQTVWFRSFRVGEAQASVRSHVAKECFKTLSGVFGKSEMRELLTEKFLVLVCELNGLFQSPSLASTPEIQRGFHLYGARPQVLTGTQPEWLVDWAQRHRVLKRTVRPTETVYSLDARAGDLYRDDENPLSHSMRREVSALAHWTFRAFGTAGLGTDFLIAITTVESAWAYREALQAEIFGWVHHPKWSITSALHALGDCLANPDETTTTRAAKALENLANWIAQARVKRRLRENLPSFLDEADRTWPAESYDEVASTWRNIVKPKLESRCSRPSNPTNAVEETINPTLGILHRLTSLVRNFFSQFRSTTADPRSIPVFESTQRLVAAIEELPIRLRDNFSAALDDLRCIAKLSSLPEIFTVLRRAADKIAGVADWTMTIYPDLTDEPLNPLPNGLFVLFWDVRASTSNPTRETLTRRIMEVNRSIKSTFVRRLIQFNADSTDDGNVAICDRFESAISVAEAVASGFAPYTVKMGCDTNADGMLSRGRSTQSVSGRAFEYAARMMAFFTEIKPPSHCWIPDSGNSGVQSVYPTEPNIGKSYLIVSEHAYRLAQELENAAEFTGRLTRLPGQYKPRVHGAYPMSLWLRVFETTGVAVQMPLLEATETGQ